MIKKPAGYDAVSYTHLDVYKRQPPYCKGLILSKCSPRTALFQAA